MLASSIAISNFPLLHFEDKASFALQCMEDYDVQHLPLVKDEHFVGLVSKDDVLNLDIDQTLFQIADQISRVGILGTMHFTAALNLFSKNELSLLPVLNEQQECMGVILQKNLNDLLAKFLGVDNPGAIIVVSISPYQYSLVELSRLVEMNNAQITQLNTNFEEATGLLIITFKINKEEADVIIATLQRYNYQVLHYFGNTILHNDIEDHYHHLMNYLDV
ncbi:MAG: CBS domain-containing protein [Sediminibacterium sp.]|jgi:acetoin utilization protein AcuB